MDAEAELALSNLHVLGALSHNDKLMTNDTSFDIYSPSTFRGLFRMWYGERRDQNIARIRHTIRTAIAHASRAFEDAMTMKRCDATTTSIRLRIDVIVVQHRRIIDALRKAREGMSNLEQTYRDDPALCSQLSLLMEEIDSYLIVIAPLSAELPACSLVGTRPWIEEDVVNGD